MKSTQLNIKSWHFQLAEFAGYDLRDSNHDICAYTRRVLLGLFFSIFLLVLCAVIIGFLGFLVSHMVLGAYFYFAYNLIPAFEFFFGWGIAGAVVIVATCRFGYTRFMDYKYRKEIEEVAEKEPSFIVTAYRAWKDKFCVKLNFVDSEGNVYNKEL